MPPRTAQAVPVPPALPMLLLLLVSAASARAAEPEEQREEGVDPEVTTCRQQCARQRQFGAAERRHCLRQCDDYGRAKRREEEGPAPERERDRCLHECRAGPPKPGCERRCREAYDRATRGRGEAGPRDLASVPARRVGGGKVQAAVA